MEIEIGAIVIAKYHAYYSFARVVSINEEQFHKVEFIADNTLVDTIKGNQILVCHFTIIVYSDECYSF